MIKKILLASTLVVSGTALHYVIPQTDIVRAVGIETKRVDREGDQEVEDAQKHTRDVYFIQTEAVDSQKPKVYRNEDQYVPYLKWHSADLQTRAQSLAADKQLVAVKHYGWRVRLFSWFPNTLKIYPVETAYTPIPWFLLTMLTLVWGAIFFVYYKIGRVTQGFRDRREAQRQARASAASASAADTDVDDFLSGSDD